MEDISICNCLGGVWSTVCAETLRKLAAKRKCIFGILLLGAGVVWFKGRCFLEKKPLSGTPQERRRAGAPEASAQCMWR